MPTEGENHVHLGSVTKLVTSGSRGWAKFYSDTGSKFVRMTNLRRNDIRLKTDDMKYVDLTGNSSEGERTSLSCGDILMSITAELGKIGWIPKNFGEAYINQHTALIRVDPEKADSRYISYFLSSQPMNNLINRMNDAGAKAGLNLSTIRSLPIRLPTKTIQTRIAEALTTWDQAIETTEELIANSISQKHALMQQLLSGKKRLKRFSGDWQEQRFEKVFTRLKRKNTTGNENVLTISGKDGLVSQREYFNKRVASNNLEGYTLLRRDDFAYNKSYSNGYPYGAIKPLSRYESGVVSSLYICFYLSNPEQHIHSFFRHFFEGGFFDREIYAIAQEGARNHGLLNVSSTDFFRTRLLIPNADEQHAIAEVIDAAERDQLNLESQLVSLQEQKRCLMQQLLTGKCRVKVATES